MAERHVHQSRAEDAWKTDIDFQLADFYICMGDADIAKQSSIESSPRGGAVICCNARLVKLANGRHVHAELFLPLDSFFGV